MRTDLTRNDVSRLLTDPSPETRATLAVKVAGHFQDTKLTGEERQLALDIIGAMAKDASMIVREALATNLKSAKTLPRGVAMALAGDIDQVALPILEYSEVLSDEDLIALVRQSSESKNTAIARRSNLNESVAEALVDTNNVHVVETLVANESAALSEKVLDKVVERYGDNERIHAPLVQRPQLPLTVAERLVAKVSDALRDYLVAHHDLSADTASELALSARERATVGLAGSYHDEQALERVIEQLRANKRLTPSLILRALCTGDVPFFEVALARLAGIPTCNARTLIHDAGPLGLKSLYQKAGLPMTLFAAVRTAVDVVSQIDLQDHEYDRDSFARTTLERVLTQCEDLTDEDADYLLRKLNDLAPPHFLA